MENQSRKLIWSKRARVVAALAPVLLALPFRTVAQRPPAVHGSGTTNTVPLWTASTTIGDSVLTQSGNNISLPGTLSATGFTCPRCVGNAQLSINYAGSSAQGGDANNALKLGGLSPSAFAQLGASNNSFSGSASFGGSLSASGINSVNGSFTGAVSVTGQLSASSVAAGNGGFQMGGVQVLSIVPGFFNLYVGQSAGQGSGSSNTGAYNTAVGFQSLFLNTSAQANTAVGTDALYSTTTGGSNVAVGAFALQSTTSGGNNTAVGQGALNSNTTGGVNTAAGNNALLSNTTGGANTGTGDGALYANSTGSANTAVGRLTLAGIGSGSNNTAIGNLAGGNLSGSDSNNIDINNGGVAGESGVIRIGAGTETATFIAGIFGVTTGIAAPAPVFVDSNGQLGTLPSSRRYKNDIQDMAEASEGLLRLRPVTFRYKKPFADGSKPIQYGLIAEEVAEVYPDVVVNGRDGQPETVQYYKLDAMLLNELQKLAKLHTADQAEIAKLRSEVAEQRREAQEQQAAMKQLQNLVRVIQVRLSASQDGSERNTAATQGNH